ncbi:alpha/beta fold hydrolase [Devosia sp. 919]|uniref:alpha/beta fold hydrolase n=1 Tax=Devosia sp. 919 TaxID=2726065 RepID=UPI00155794F8
MEKNSARPLAAQRWLWSLLAGLAFAVTALLASASAQLRINPAALGNSGEITVANILLGVFLCGSLVWWLLVIRPGQVSLVRGAVAGVLVACFSYPAVLLLAEFLHSDARVAADLASLLRQLGYVLVQSALGLVTTGFASTIALALTGMLIAFLQRRSAVYLAPSTRGTKREVGLLRRMFRGLVFCAAFAVVTLVAVFVGLTVLPTPQLAASTPPRPAESYAQALAGFAVIQAQEATLPLRPECRSQLQTHGDKVAGVVIYFHGLTSCPAQGDELASRLFGLGYNVLVPRLPGHGEADPLTLALASVTAEDFVDTAEFAIALAQGLGDEVIITGLSAGGTITTFETQNDSTLAGAISVAPFLGPAFLPPWATQAATNLLLLLPNMMLWWNPETPYSSPRMPYVYPRFATRAVAELMRLGRITAAQAAWEAPAAQGIGVLLNEADHSVNNALAQQLVAQWREDGRTVDLRFLPQADGLPHDVIDPREPHGGVSIVYPILLDMIAVDSK